MDFAIRDFKVVELRCSKIFEKVFGKFIAALKIAHMLLKISAIIMRYYRHFYKN